VPQTLLSKAIAANRPLSALHALPVLGGGDKICVGATASPLNSWAIPLATLHASSAALKTAGDRGTPNWRHDRQQINIEHANAQYSYACNMIQARHPPQISNHNLAPASLSSAREQQAVANPICQCKNTIKSTDTTPERR
jgi:hypothetical protein